jgi:hypothetical protein
MHSFLLACLLACLCCGSFKNESRRVQERAAREKKKERKKDDRCIIRTLGWHLQNRSANREAVYFAFPFRVSRLNITFLWLSVTPSPLPPSPRVSIGGVNWGPD